MKRIDTEPIPFPIYPGTISKETLPFFLNFENMGWYSIKDPSLRGLFLPKPIFDHLVRLPCASGNAIDEVWKVFLAHQTAAYGQVPPKNDLSVSEEKVIVKNSNPVGFAPIPDPFSQRVISTFIENSSGALSNEDIFIIWKMVHPKRRLVCGIKREMEKVSDNLEVLDALFLFGFRLAEKGGLYRLVPSALQE